jgi:hypothetical protein
VTTDDAAGNGADLAVPGEVTRNITHDGAFDAALGFGLRSLVPERREIRLAQRILAQRMSPAIGLHPRRYRQPFGNR